MSSRRQLACLCLAAHGLPRSQRNSGARTGGSIPGRGMPAPGGAYESPSGRKSAATWILPNFCALAPSLVRKLRRHASQRMLTNPFARARTAHPRDLSLAARWAATQKRPTPSGHQPPRSRAKIPCWDPLIAPPVASKRPFTEDRAAPPRFATGRSRRCSARRPGVRLKRRALVDPDGVAELMPCPKLGCGAETVSG